jgi:polyisoprenyl-phosphate glycosyltransferase
MNDAQVNWVGPSQMTAAPADLAAPKLSVVVPCYNEEGSLQALYERVTKVCQQEVGSLYELVLINDGSKDKTLEIMRGLTAADPHVVGVDLSRNHGHQLALSAGLRVCRGERILVLDADLQDPPELLPQMMAMVESGVDVVYGQRTERKGETWFKRVTAEQFYKFLNALSDIDIPRDTGDFRLMTRPVLDALNAMPEHDRFIRGMVSWLGFNQKPIHYIRDARFAGVTNYPLKKMIRFSIDAITGFSVRPLRVAIMMAAICSLLALLTLAYVIWSWATEVTLPGWTSLMFVVLLVSAAQMLVLGIFGEYLGRLYVSSKGRPLYIIREILHNR